jgi:uncharacterized protein YbaA (DUF1428 family)
MDVRRAGKKGPEEAAFLSPMEWLSEATRDAAWHQFMAVDAMEGAMPFDDQRIIHGGFVPVLQR